VKNAVQAVERVSAAELVVAVRPSSGHYRHADLALGALLALIVLCVFLYHPAPFDFTFLPIELAGAFLIGALSSVSIAPLRRLLIRRRLMDENVQTSARATFVELGVHRTRGRSGLLVLVSSFERRAEVVVDIGVPARELGSGWTEWQARVQTAADKRDTAAFLAALAALGPLLAEKLPRSADDVNELGDDVHEAAA
jgi:putative membrane protein